MLRCKHSIWSKYMQFTNIFTNMTYSIRKTWKKRWRNMKRICEVLQFCMHQPWKYFPLVVALFCIVCGAKNCPKQSVKNQGFSSRMLLLLLLSVVPTTNVRIASSLPANLPTSLSMSNRASTPATAPSQAPSQPVTPLAFDLCKSTQDHWHGSLSEFSQGWNLTPLFVQELGRRLPKPQFQRNPHSIVLLFSSFF